MGRGGMGAWVHTMVGKTRATGRGGTGMWVNVMVGKTRATGRGSTGAWVHAMAGEMGAMDGRDGGHGWLRRVRCGRDMWAQGVDSRGWRRWHGVRGGQRQAMGMGGVTPNDTWGSMGKGWLQGPAVARGTEAVVWGPSSRAMGQLRCIEGVRA